MCRLVLGVLFGVHVQLGGIGSLLPQGGHPRLHISIGVRGELPALAGVVAQCGGGICGSPACHIILNTTR